MNHHFNHKEERPTSLIAQLFTSMAFKLFLILILVVFLLIPLNWISNLIRERKDREVSVSTEIASKWAGPQVISGPIIAVPFDYQSDVVTVDANKKEKISIQNQREWILRLADDLSISATVSPEYLQRGIYKAVVYNSTVHIEGNFSKIELDKVDKQGGAIKWGEAKLVFGIEDFKGLSSFPELKWKESSYPLNNTYKSLELFNGNLTADIPLTESDLDHSVFEIDLRLRGSRSLNILPLADQTNVDITGTWAHPSFNGAFLPEKREVGDTSFTANWSVPNFSRKTPKQWQSDGQSILYTFSGYSGIDDSENYLISTAPTATGATQVRQSSDGDMLQINFLPEVNNYQKITRVSKYAALIILLTFTALILVEIVKKQRIHIIQYVLIGISMVLFYSLLLAFSEHVRFNVAYLLSSIATIALISGFVFMLLKKPNISLAVAGVLLVFYGFVYFLMQMRDYSLLVGSIGVFIILAVVMRFSAKINWYELNKTNDEHSAAKG